MSFRKFWSSKLVVLLTDSKELSGISLHISLSTKKSIVDRESFSPMRWWHLRTASDWFSSELDFSNILLHWSQQLKDDRSTVWKIILENTGPNTLILCLLCYEHLTTFLLSGRPEIIKTHWRRNGKEGSTVNRPVFISHMSEYLTFWQCPWTSHPLNIVLNTTIDSSPLLWLELHK